MDKGCGRGYDVVLLALHGFDAYGLEISQTAVAEAEKYAAAEVKSPSDYNYASADCSSRRHDPGKVKFVEGDFFGSDWDSRLGDANGKFDLIYDYTVRSIRFLTLSTGKLISIVPVRAAPIPTIRMGNKNGISSERRWFACLPRISHV